MCSSHSYLVFLCGKVFFCLVQGFCLFGGFLAFCTRLEIGFHVIFYRVWVLLTFSISSNSPLVWKETAVNYYEAALS